MVNSVNGQTGAVTGIATASDVDALEARVDNIVAPSGDPSLTEVSDARVGADSTVYSTLKGRIDGEVSELNERIDDIVPGLSEDAKTALLACFQHIAFLDDDADYYGALESALYAVTTIHLNTRSLLINALGSTSQLTAITVPAGGTVTWASSDTSVATVDNTGLVTSVAYGSAIITATSGGVSATCAVTISQVTLESISAVYTQSGTVYDNASLSDLTSDLVVTATWSDSSTSVVSSADYVLSGTLSAGTSTVTVSYGGQTDTFSVIVTETPAPAFDYGIYEPETIVNGKYIDANGDIQTASGAFYIEDYIPVVRSDYWIGMNPSSLRVPAPGTAPTNESDWRISEYDVSKNFIKQTHYESISDLRTSTLFNFDSNTKYIRLGWNDSNSSTNTKEFDIENPAGITVLPVEIGNIDANTGANAESTTRFKTAGYIPVSNTITITGCPFYDSWSDWVSLWTSAGYSQDSFFYVVRCYDSSKAFLGSLTYNGSGIIRQDISNVSLPAGTAYVRMLFQTENYAALATTCINHLVTINSERYYLEMTTRQISSNDILMHSGYSTFNVSNGIVSVSGDKTFSGVVFNKNIKLFDGYLSYRYGIDGQDYDGFRCFVIFYISNDFNTFYGTDGAKAYVFTRNNDGSYSATASTTIGVISGTVTHDNDGKVTIRRENGHMYITHNDNVFEIESQYINVIGVWSSEPSYISRLEGRVISE